MRIPVVMCIDVEPDAREVDASGRADWAGLVPAHHFFGQLRPELEDATGAPACFSWFLRMDAQIERAYGSPTWVAERHPEIFRELDAAGDELGLHTHAWRWDEPSRRWIADHGNQEWVEHCVRVSFEAFQKALGRPCRTFRFGDHWMNDETMRLLEELGARFDLTVEPGRKAPRVRSRRELSTGSLPDYRSVPRHPYRPSRSNFKEPSFTDGREIQVIPLSTAKPGRPTMGRLLNPKRAAKYCLSVFRDPVQLNPCHDAADFRQMLDGLLRLRNDSYLAPVLRVDGFTEPQQRDNLEQNFRHILKHPLAGRLMFVTPSKAVELLSQGAPQARP